MRIGAMVLGLFWISACSVTPDRARWPQTWSENIQTLAIERQGGWFRRDRSLRIGPYQLQPVDRSWWQGVPGHSGFGVQLGGIAVGVETIHDESEFSFRLLAQGADVAAVRCQQYLHVENWQGGVGDRNIGSIIIEGNLAYLATLRCQAVGFHPDWPEWRLDLRAVSLRPFFGVLRAAGRDYSVAGTQQADSGVHEASTGFEWRDGERIVARLNRIGDRDLSLREDLPAAQRLALLAAAGSLLLANDPLNN